MLADVDFDPLGPGLSFFSVFPILNLEFRDRSSLVIPAPFHLIVPESCLNTEEDAAGGEKRGWGRMRVCGE